MDNQVIYHSDQQENVEKVSESTIPFMKTFSSQEETEMFRLQQNLAMSDMEKFQKFCRLMRIGKMLSANNQTSYK